MFTGGSLMPAMLSRIQQAYKLFQAPYVVAEASKLDHYPRFFRLPRLRARLLTSDRQYGSYAEGGQTRLVDL